MLGVAVRHGHMIHPGGPHADACGGEGLKIGGHGANGLAQRAHVHELFEVGRVVDLEVRHVNSLTC